MKVLIIGAGIGGLTFALALHQRGIDCELHEAVPSFRSLGVGLNLLPHAVREMEALGLTERLLSKGIETSELCFYTRHGQLVDREPRGVRAGYGTPQISIHRADLHDVLLQAVRERLGPDAVNLDRRCIGFDQGSRSVTARFVDQAGVTHAAEGTILIACDGLHSAVRKQLHPSEPPPIEHVTMSYRGVSRWPAFLSGSSMVYVGTYDTGKLVIYPVRDRIDPEGRQLINWVIEIVKEGDRIRDWAREASIEECIEPFESWHHDWLDVPAMLRASERVLPYPNLDQEPLQWWTQGRVTLLGDAAHPMLPRGSNGAAQAILDTRVLSDLLAQCADPIAALHEYESIRRPVTAKVVLTNRETPPDAILRVVEERTGGKPFRHIDDVISREERDRWQESYKRIVGMARANSKGESLHETSRS